MLNLILINNSYAVANHSPDIQNYVNDILKKTLSILSDESKSLEEKISESEVLIKKNMDFTFMSRASLGRMSRQLSDNDLKRYEDIYTRYVLRTYSSNIRSYKNQDLKVTQTVNLGGNDYKVSTLISRDSRSPIRVEYVVRKTPSGFKVIDIITEGVSLVYTQQSEFTNLIRNNNGDINILINRLQEQVKNIK